MKVPETMGSQTPETKKPLDQALQQAETLISEIHSVEEEIQEVTKTLHERKQRLVEELSGIAKEVSKTVPKVPCLSSHDEDALKDGDYYVIGLPEDVDPKKVEIEANKYRTTLMINGEEYEGEWEYTDTEDDVLVELLNRRKKTEE